MWISTSTVGKLDHGHWAPKEHLFNELYNECRSAAPGARLSFRLRAKLEKMNRHERKEIASKMMDGCSPLFVACKRGNLDIVDYLLSVCGADVEQRGKYEVPDDRSIHCVAPLWCAAVAGKLAVVKCLVEHGATVNSVSDTGSTPVRSACFMTHLDIVKFLVERGADIQKPNDNGGTCLINSVQSVPLCELLLEHGAPVNAQDIQQKTALHYAIQEHRYETTCLLLAHGANPLLRSRFGDDALQTACLKGAARIFDHLVALGCCDRARIADMHELIGTTFLDEHHDLPLALKYWRRALEIREMNGESSGAKEPLRKECMPLKEAYQMATEFTTLGELENLALDLDAVRTQSLLICERILGPNHKDTIFRLMYRGAAYADSLRYQRCFELWRYALELRISKDCVLNADVGFTAQSLVRLFLDLLDRSSGGELRERVRWEDVMATLHLLCKQLPSAVSMLEVRPVHRRQQENFELVLRVITHLVLVLLAIETTGAQELTMKRLINHVIRLNPCTPAKGDSLLHLAVSGENLLKVKAGGFDEIHAAVFPSRNVVELLLECGADPNQTNDIGSTALHVSANPRNFNQPVVELLLKAGAHLDQSNMHGLRALDLLGLSDCSVCPLNHVSLMCLAARVIIENKITYANNVPLVLEDFIMLH